MPFLMLSGNHLSVLWPPQGSQPLLWEPLIYFICWHSSSLMCRWTVWSRILNPEILPCYKSPCQEITLTGICEAFWCVCMYVCVKFWGWRSCEHLQDECTVYSGFVHAVCVGTVCFMSPGCSQCGEEGSSVHGRRAGGQSRQSTGEPAGQWR